MSAQKSEKLFFAPKGSYCRKLNPKEAATSPLSSSTVIQFSGEIDLERFYQAVDKAAQEFNWVYCKLYKRNGDIFAEYTSSGKENPKKDSYLKVEVKSWIILAR